MPERSDRQRLVVLAAAAHPDDIEFNMAGTLLRLGDLGAELHMWSLASGSCGTTELDAATIKALRAAESAESARIARAELHPPLVDDFELFYEPGLLARVAAVLRRIAPRIVLAPSPQDYMEDHQNACRLLVSAAFVRGMRNYECVPSTAPIEGPLALYHAMPHGLRDGLGRLVRPGLYVRIHEQIERKTAMLAAHRSQREWLEISQGIDAYVIQMIAQGRELGRLSGCFESAEGWRRHNHLGLGPQGDDPLAALLGPDCRMDSKYVEELG